jgi:hypothetical protein
MLSFDSTTNSIEGIYKESFLIYLNLKRELEYYVDFELQKHAAAQSFHKNPNSTVSFKGNQYTSNLLLLFGTRYNMDLPARIETPKIGIAYAAYKY